VRVFATSARLALYQGPVPIRSRALVGRFPFAASRSTLRYARQVRAPWPTAAANRWHVASAPVRPPRLPVTLVELVTKKLIVGPDGAVVVRSLLQPAAARTTSSSSVRLTSDLPRTR